MKYQGKTPPVRGPRGEPIAGDIAEINDLRLGGQASSSLDWLNRRSVASTEPTQRVDHRGGRMVR
jgi:hypothetical protein